MRLLHTKELYLAEFFDYKIPKYAILSHRWEEDEVSLQDFEQGKKKDGAGYRKILKCCALAKSQRFDWVWIDTCCIDKKSSAEVSESINSMFQWYENAGICYAYLSDVPYYIIGGRRVKLGYERSEWFTRGWTLQELLAPEHLLFLDLNWEVIGTRRSLTHKEAKDDFSHSLSEITRIPATILHWGWRHFNNLELKENEPSVAQRMSWASERQTSRVEDMAYCLLGIFNINMPLLYGEGEKAFVRLQQKIIKQSEDESVFAWTIPNVPRARHRHQTSLFATSPSYFVRSGGVERRNYTSWIKQSPYQLTDAGVRMDVLLIPLLENCGEMWLLPLNCETEGRRNAVVLQTSNGRSFRKVCSMELLFVDGADLKYDFEDKVLKQRLQCEWPEAHEISTKNPERNICVGARPFGRHRLKLTAKYAEDLMLSQNKALKAWGL